MSGPALPSPRSDGNWCEECGYSLRGLPSGQPCPECGHLTREDEFQPSPYTAWARRVFFGLVLLLIPTIDAVSAVLIQPSNEALGGTGPGLNFPGPKLWAVPLLQRPLGHTVELPGVAGTRAAMLSLLAVWLITAPCAAARLQPDQPLRRLTRWLSLGLFGAVFGVLLATEGLSPYRDLSPYRLLLVAGAELPAGALLYAYLYRLAGHVTGRARRAALGRLAWLVPLVVAGGAAALGLQWVRAQAAANVTRTGAELTRLVTLVWSAGYGVVAVGSGVAATAAVVSLAGAYFRPAFPRARRWVSGGRYVWRRARAWAAGFSPARAADLRVAGGLVLLVLAVFVGSDHVLWMSARQGLGGNLPFLNYPGPKVWAAALSVGLGGYEGYSWTRVVSRSLLAVLNVGAVWLLTTTGQPDAGRPLRLGTRWATVLAVGATVGYTMALKGNSHRYESPETVLTSKVFALMTVAFEWPATALLYYFLARLARTRGRPTLARQFHLINAAIFLLVVGAMLLFVLSRPLSVYRRTTAVLTLSAVYGAATLATATVATAGILVIAGAVLRDGVAQKEATPPGSGVAGSDSN